MSKSKTPAVDKFNLINQQIVTALEAGVKPWKRPWKSEGGDFQNLVSQHVYAGLNPLFCSIYNFSYGYSSPYFLTFNQARDRGWQIKPGSKAGYIRFAANISTEVESEGEVTTENHFCQKWSAIFSIECVDDSNSPNKIEDAIAACSRPNNSEDRSTTAEGLIASTHAIIEYGGDRAAYNPARDRIVMPQWEQFESAAKFYATHIHELVHWSGHANRLHRVGIVNLSYFGSAEYAYEELIAEIGAAYVCSYLFPEYATVEIDHHAAYLSSWLKALKQDPNAIFRAMKEAQKASEYLMAMLPAKPVPSEGVLLAV